MSEEKYTIPTFTLGGGRWNDDGKFNWKACICGELESYTGPCVCLNQGSGFFTCLFAAIIFPFNCIVGCIIGIYNWIMCNACLTDDYENIEFQDNLRKCIVPCGCRFYNDGKINIINCLLGNIRCKPGPCICLSSGDGPIDCLCSILCVPFNVIIGCFLGLVNWITCGACTKDLENSSIGTLIHV